MATRQPQQGAVVARAPGGGGDLDAVATQTSQMPVEGFQAAWRAGEVVDRDDAVSRGEHRRPQTGWESLQGSRVNVNPLATGAHRQRQDGQLSRGAAVKLPAVAPAPASGYKSGSSPSDAPGGKALKELDDGCHGPQGVESQLDDPGYALSPPEGAPEGVGVGFGHHKGNPVRER
jgi:hypothetical protein